MKASTRKRIEQYVSENIGSFHLKRIQRLSELRLNDVLKNKNPYLFRAKNLTRASDLMTAILDARLSSSEEGSFGGFLENLAIYVAEMTGGGNKSAATGIDIELVRGATRYLIAVKSGKNWGNASHYAALKANLYVDLIEPVGYEAERHDQVFKHEKDNTYNRLIRDFANTYCDASGAVDWPRLVQFVCGNLT